jgi:hypothetical protein
MRGASSVIVDPEGGRCKFIILVASPELPIPGTDDIRVTIIKNRCAEIGGFKIGDFGMPRKPWTRQALLNAVRLSKRP